MCAVLDHDDMYTKAAEAGGSRFRADAKGKNGS